MATPVKALPAVYAKFVTALAGNAIAYLTAYGATWHLQAALVGLGAALAVFGVPNADKPEAAVPVSGGVIPSGAVKIYSPADGPPEPVKPPPGPAGASS